MNNKFQTPLVPISWGELIDKITILEIKEVKITSNYRTLSAIAKVFMTLFHF